MEELRTVERVGKRGRAVPAEALRAIEEQPGTGVWQAGADAGNRKGRGTYFGSAGGKRAALQPPGKDFFGHVNRPRDGAARDAPADLRNSTRPLSAGSCFIDSACPARG